RFLHSLACVLAGGSLVFAQQTPTPPPDAVLPPPAASAKDTPPAMPDKNAPPPPAANGFPGGWTLPFLADGESATKVDASAERHISAEAEFLWWAIKKSRPLPSLIIGTDLRNRE